MPDYWANKRLLERCRAKEVAVIVEGQRFQLNLGQNTLQACMRDARALTEDPHP